MNHKAKIIPNIVLPGILTISGVAGIIAIATATTTSALTYSSDTDVSFTFNPTLSISLSNANINIDNLLPGLSSESSPITVHVNSNTPYGYSLFASVGNSTDYNTTSLVHGSNDNSNNNSSNDNNNSNNNSIPSTFTSIATNASLPQLDTDNTWGYSFSNDNGSTWSNYNGLPLYSTVGNNTSTNNPALLIDTKSPADSTESIDFKIAAKASSTQASGTYNNVINFYAVGKPEPFTINRLHYMQDFKGLAETDKQSVLDSMSTGEQYQLEDTRDNKTYYISKLMDDNIWMTQNLDFDIDSNKTYTSADTDVISDWKPNQSTVTTKYWSISYQDLFSYDPGDRYWNGDIHNTWSGKIDDMTTSNVLDVNNGLHYHIGNYYKWNAAVAENSGSGNSTRRQSICPAGWQLPTRDGDKSFRTLKDVQNLSSGVSGNLQNSPTYLIYGGSWHGGSSYVGRLGGYWLNEFQDDGGGYYAYHAFIGADGVFSPSRSGIRDIGYNVRCVVR